MAYLEEVTADNPLHWYRLNESSGTTISNSGSSTQSLSKAGTGSQFGTTGIPGAGTNKAMTFTGGTLSHLTSNQSVTYASDDVFTVECWFKTTDTDATLVMWFAAPYWYMSINADGTLNFSAGAVDLDSAVTVNDNNWHHGVAVVNGTTSTLYLDGVAVDTYTGDPGTFSGTATFYLSDNRSAYSYSGVMDEVAIYDSALSAARIKTHYEAGMNIVAQRVDVATATASADIYEPLVSTPRHEEISLTTATALVQPHDATTEVSAMVATNHPTNFIPSSKKYIVVGGFSAARTNFKFTFTSTGAATINVAPINEAGTVIGDAQTISVGASGTYTNTLYFNTEGLAMYGFQITGTSVTLRDETDIVNYRPVITGLNPYVITNVAVDLDTPSATLTGQTPSVGGGTGVNLPTATVSTLSNNVTVEVTTDPNVEVNVSTAQTTVDAHDGDVAISIAVALSETGTALVASHDATPETTQGVTVDLDTPRINVTHIRVTDINGEAVLPTESEDPYFTSTWRTLRSVKRGVTGGLGADAQDRQMSEDFAVWLRLNERSGTAALDRADTVPPFDQFGTYDNVVIGQAEGPNGRHSVHFNGDAVLAEGPFEGLNYGPTSFEFTFRTDKANQFIMGGEGINPTSYVSGYVWWDVWLVDGRIEYRFGTNSYDPVSGFVRSGTQVLKGTKNLADGKWHHIVLQQAPERTSGGLQNYGTEIYVDSLLEVRRRLVQAVPDFPDFIGGRYNSDEYAGREVVDRSDWFVGDMTELVFRNGRMLTVDEIAIQRDNVFGIIPVRPNTARSTVKANDATAKGNKARVLVLDFGRPGTAVAYRYTSGPLGEKYASTLSTNAADGGYVPFYFDNFGSVIHESPKYHMFRYQVVNDYRRDEVTDNPRLLDLSKDLNMEDYDIITIVDFPQSTDQWVPYDTMDSEAVAPFVPARIQLEHLVAQIKGQAKAGKGLYISDPGAAVAFGIVDRVEFVPNLTERVYRDRRIGATSGMYDWQSARTNPWINSTTDEQAEANAARFVDTHANLKHRVRNLVAGLTDIPSWVLTDFQIWVNTDPMGTPPMQEYKRHEPRLQGLALGDEMYLEGSGIGHSLMDWVVGGGPGWGTQGLRHGWIGAPLQNVKAGKAVTTFESHLWMGHDRVENPYKDHAVTIAIEPGDTWDGDTVQGRVFVNLTEYGANLAGGIDRDYYQVVPEGAETPAKRYWTFTHERGTWNGATVSGDTGSGGVIQIAPDGSISLGQGITSKTPVKNVDSLVSFSWSGSVPQVTIEVLNMNNRGLLWLINGAGEDDNATVGVDTASVSVKAVEPVVETQRNAVVDLSTARTQAEAVVPADVVYADVAVLVTTPTAVLKAGAFREVIEVGTARVTASAHDDIDTMRNYGEVIELTLPFHEVTLILEEV